VCIYNGTLQLYPAPSKKEESQTEESQTAIKKTIFVGQRQQEVKGVQVSSEQRGPLIAKKSSSVLGPLSIVDVDQVLTLSSPEEVGEEGARGGSSSPTEQMLKGRQGGHIQSPVSCLIYCTA